MSTSQQSLHSPDEEDLGWKEPWHSDDELDPYGAATTNSFQHTKGKAMATGYRRRPPSSYASENGDTDGVSHLSSQRRSTEAYPPTTDEDAGTRRVVENLRRWEIAERQRWKAARESNSSGPSSVLANVVRRVTSLWSRRASHAPADSGGRHRVLQTSDDSGHLEDVVPVSSPSAVPSPSLTPLPERPHAGPYAHTNDPFSDPPGSTSSLFVNALPVTSDIGASASSIALEATPTSATDSRPTRVSRSIETPAPFDLPKPRSPPPRTATPHANRPPEPFPRPDSRMSYATTYDDEAEKPVRWWTEWLCGCSEGPDRGGEIQAGRTNPLE